MARRSRLTRALLWTSAGAAAAYFGDPDLGRSRRARTKDQVAAKLRRLDRKAQQKASYVASTAEGKVEQLTRSDSTPPPDDRTLVDKIKSEVLGREEFAPHDVVIDAVDGVVTLRGELPDSSLADALEKAVEKEPGVRAVRNLLHEPGAPAPNKQDALRRSASR